MSIGQERWQVSLITNAAQTIKIICVLGQTCNGKQDSLCTPTPFSGMYQFFPRCLSLFMPEYKLQIKLFYGKS